MMICASRKQMSLIDDGPCMIRRNFAKYASLEIVSGSGRSSDTSGSADFGSVPLVKYTTESDLKERTGTNSAAKDLSNRRY